MKVTIDDLWLKNDDDGNPPSYIWWFLGLV